MNSLIENIRGKNPGPATAKDCRAWIFAALNNPEKDTAVDQVREEFLAAVLQGFSSRDLETLVELQRRLFENSRNALEGRRSDPK